MNKDIRIEKLREIVENATPRARKDIHYKGEQKTMDVFEVPLEYLIFNQYNGRIATFVKTHEKQHEPIDATTQEGEKLINQFLWDSQKSRNKTTQEDLREKGQLEYGIVTADGVVIDGNRRFMLLKKNKEKHADATGYFKAIILEDTLESNPKEIMRLETTYQLGVDDKVDYSPIQKYLKCRDLGEEGFSEKEIAKMMRENEPKIKEYLATLELMDEYLTAQGYEGMYRALESDDRPLTTQLEELNLWLSKYRGERKQIRKMNWQPNAEDLADFQTVYFDYMRAGFEVRDTRIIGNPSTGAKGQGIFTQKDLWAAFAKNHFDNVESGMNDDKPLQEMRDKNPGIDVVDLISARDTAFREKIEGPLKGNLNRTKRELEDREMEHEPLELLTRAKKTLEKVKPDVETFGTLEVRALAKEIQSMAYDFMKLADEKMKNK